MVKRYLCCMLLCILMMTSFSAIVFATPDVTSPSVLVSNSGVALLFGETDLAAGTPVFVQIVPKDEDSVTSAGTINGYVNETFVESDGTYKLVFPLGDSFQAGTEYVCHVDMAGRYFPVTVESGSLIEISSKEFDRDTKTITVSGSLWDTRSFGIDLILQIGSYQKTVASTAEGEFTFTFTMAEAGITTYGMKNFRISYADDALSYCDDSVELVNVDGMLATITQNARNAAMLETIFTTPANLNTLGFGSEVLYGDCEFSALSGSDFFTKLANSNLNTDSVSGLRDSIRLAYSLYNMEIAPSDSNLRRCIECFGLAADDAYLAIYDSFNADTDPAYLFDLWDNQYFTNASDACAFFQDSVLLTKLNNAEAWSNLMSFVNSNNTLLSVAQQTSNSFWSNLVLNRPFTSVGDFQSKYATALNGLNTPPPIVDGGTGGFAVGGGAPVASATPAPTPFPILPEIKNEGIFSDVNKEHWAFEAISTLHEKGIINGKADGVFAPNDLVTRAEVAKLMCTAANINVKDGSQGDFSDVANSHWAIGYIQAAFENGLVNGIGNGNYGPQNCTTREDMAVFCYRLLKHLKPELESKNYTKEELPFQDAAEISDYAAEAVGAMSELGIINGKGEQGFDPKAYCTRAEAAKIFYGVLQ